MRVGEYRWKEKFIEVPSRRGAWSMHEWVKGLGDEVGAVSPQCHLLGLKAMIW